MNSIELFADFLHSFLSYASEQLSQNYYANYDETKNGFQLISGVPCRDYNNIILILREHISTYGYEISEQGFIKKIIDENSKPSA